MLKFWGVFAACLGGSFFAFYQARALPLYYYILCPLLIYPVFYYWYRRRLYFAVAASVLAAVFLAVASPRNSYLNLLFIFWVECGLVFLSLLFYWFLWEKDLNAEVMLKERMLTEWSQLEKKHKARVDSLKHLENQVNGLLKLFENARDFSEALSYDVLAELLHRNVAAEKLFSRIYLVPLELNTGEEQTAFIITEASCEKKTLLLSREDLQSLEESKRTSSMVQKKDRFYFSIFEDDLLIACFIAEGILADDLARVEVLMAFLALHIRKIRLYEKVKEMAIRDSLTGVFVRRHFVERFEEELKRANKYKLPLAVLMLDIDYFKRYNDEHGHLAGDAALKQVSQLLRDNLRKVDIIARYGGEEFVMIVPETRMDGALEAAERIRSGIARHHFDVYNQKTRVTVSIGAALFPEDLQASTEGGSFSQMALDLIQHADKAMYRAKEEGRNRVVFYHQLGVR